jgi:hypothetical protein
MDAVVLAAGLEDDPFGMDRRQVKRFQEILEQSA